MTPTNRSSANLLAAAANVPESSRPIFIEAAHRESTREAVVECERCPLGRLNPSRVPWVGNPTPIFLLTGPPSAPDLTSGQPLSTYHLRHTLTTILNNADLTWSQIALGPALGCHPHPSVDTTAAYESCAPHVDAAITAAQSWIVVILGDAPYAARFPERDSNHDTFWHDGILYMATYSVEDAYQSTNATYHLTSTLSDAALIAATDKAAPPVTSWDESAASKLMPERHRQQFRSAYRKRGWVVLHAALIGQQLAIVENESIDIPDPWSDLPRYTLAEINKLIPTPELFRRVHIVKQAIGGTVL